MIQTLEWSSNPLYPDNILKLVIPVIQNYVLILFVLHTFTLSLISGSDVVEPNVYISPFLSIAIGKERATISFLFYKCSEAQKCLATNNIKRATDNIHEGIT